MTTRRAATRDGADSGAMETDPGRTAFICAMPMELKPLARRLALKKSQVDGVTVGSGTLDDSGDAVLLLQPRCD